MPNSALWQALNEGLAIQNTQILPQFRFENGFFIPTVGDLPPGKDTVNSVFLGGSFGPEAILLAPGASDIPLTPVSFTTEQVPVVMAAKGYSVQWQEARTLSQFNTDGTNLNEVVTNAKIAAVKFELSRRMERYAVYGEPVLGHVGMYNNPNVSQLSSSFNPNTATYSDWVTFLVDLILSSGLSIDGEIILEPTTVLMSQRALVRASQVMNPINGMVSALEAARTQLNLPDNNNLNIEFARSPWSAGLVLEKYGIFPPAFNKDRFIVYTKSDTVLLRRIESDVAQLVDEDFLSPTQGLTKIFPMFMCSSSTIIMNPAGIRYVDVVRAT